MGGKQTGSIFKRGFSGALSGVAGTAVMSAALAASDLFGVMDRQPPRMIVEDLLPGLSQEETTSVALIAHVGYGVGAGAAYGILVAPEHRNTWTGTLYGVAVWVVGYEGWLPLLGILPPAHRDKRGRSLTMFAAHVIHGAALGRAAARRHRRSSH